MPPQLGKSILLLPTAARSDSSGSKIKFKDVTKKKKKRKGKTVSIHSYVSVSYKGNDESVDTFFEEKTHLKKLPSSARLPYPG